MANVEIKESTACLRWLAIKFAKDIGDRDAQPWQDIVASQCFVFVQDFVDSHQLSNNLRVIHIRQTFIPAVVRIRQSFVVQTKLM
jgi:hypothetical protein